MNHPLDAVIGARERRIAALTAECDRLREALERIVAEQMPPDGWYCSFCSSREIAASALRGEQP